jgi:hypothetical protein
VGVCVGVFVGVGVTDVDVGVGVIDIVGVGVTDVDVIVGVTVGVGVGVELGTKLQSVHPVNEAISVHETNWRNVGVTPVTQTF